MTHRISSSGTTVIRRTSTLLRTATYTAHVIVLALACASLATSHFESWIDLRTLGPAAALIKTIWALTAIAIPFLAGPWPGGTLRKPRWIHHGFSARWARWLLWPTYFLIACLIINTAYYFKLLRDGLTDSMVPMPLLAALLLAAWTLWTREWIRREPLMPVAAPARRWLHFRTTLCTLPFALFIVAGVVVPTYSRPPARPVDLAVVLGGRIRPDGSPSSELAARVRTAIDLYQRGLVKHILLSGDIGSQQAAPHIATDEIAAMQQVCLTAGLPEDAYSLDPVGINTKATAFNTKLFMRTRGYKTLVACSSDFHLYRTHMAFKKVGLDAFALPAKDAEWQCDNPKDTVRELIAIAVYTLVPDYRQAKAMTMQLKTPRIIVHKQAGTLELFDGAKAVKTYPCITGGEPGDKAVEGDRRTPIGKFRIVYKNPQSKFHLSLGLDYPNREDAERGLRTGLISRQEFDGILQALASDLTKEENQKKLWYTKLGGEIFIHGHANGRPGTAGCVALSNPDIEELYAILPVGTPVEVQP